MISMKSIDTNINDLAYNAFIDEPKNEEVKIEGNFNKIRQLNAEVRVRIEAIKQICSKNESKWYS